MDIKTIALILLIGRAISLFFVYDVMKRQLRIKKANIKVTPAVKKIREVLFRDSLILIAGSLVPVLIDVLTILPLVETGRAQNVSPIGVAYAFSSMGVSLLFSYDRWIAYRQAEQSQVELVATSNARKK